MGIKVLPGWNCILVTRGECKVFSVEIRLEALYLTGGSRRENALSDCPAYVYTCDSDEASW